MTTYSFDTVVGQSIAFDKDADDLNIAYGADVVTLTQDGANLVVTVANVGTVTLTGTTLGNMVGAGTAQNISVANGIIAIGDETTSDALDTLSQNPINGGTGSDLLYGMGGSDTIDGSNGATGDDILFGGTGITDTTDGADQIITGTGNTTVYGNAGGDNIDVGAVATGNTQTVFGGLGNEDLDTGALVGDAIIYGNSGNDNINFSNATATSSVTVFGGNGITDSTDGGDTIIGGQGNSVIYGNAGNDTIVVEGGANTVTSVIGGIGVDDIQDQAGATGSGTYDIAGGWGGDTLRFDSLNTATAITVYGGNGLTDAGDTGVDTITVSTAVNASGALASAALYGNGGDDSITLNTATNASATFVSTINGGLGDDTVAVTLATGQSSTINTGAGNDTVTLNTGAGADATFTVEGYETTDTLTLNLNGATAAAVTVATGSSSTVIDDGADGAVVLNGYTGNLNLTMGGTSLLKSNTTATAATLTGGTGDDQLISGSAGDTFSFTAAQYADGTDKLVGGSGTDVLLISEGAETITDFSVITGVETIDFGSGAAAANQAVDLTNAGADSAVGVTLIDGSELTTGTLGVTDTADTGENVTVTGSAAVDTVVLDVQTGNLTLNGNAGADALTGGAGTDVINGGADADTLLVGGAGNDTIDGGAGADTISGGADTDSLTGGTGADDFNFALAADSGQTLTTVDVITDFNADEDTVSFQVGDDFTDSTAVDTSGDANLLAAANTAITSALLGGAGNYGQAGDVVEFVFGGRTFVVVNDGANAVASAADLIVDISGFTGSLDAADFIA